MRVALGFKSHSGWAALVVIGETGSEFRVIDCRRIELIEEGELWAKQPYHAAEDLDADEARNVVNRGVESAHRIAVKQLREIANEIQKSGHEIAGYAVLIPSPMPDWSTAEILAVHMRMHKAEGFLFPDALCRAAEKCGLPLIEIREKQIDERAELAFAAPFDSILEIITALGRSVGPPWGKDQKSAALAAMIALL